MIEENKNILMGFIKEILRSDNGNNNLMFLTIRYVYGYNDKRHVLKKSKDIMGGIYKKLFGNNWKYKLCKSIYVIEHGKDKQYHLHAIINLEDIEPDKFIKAIDKTIKQCPWCNLCYDIQYNNEKIVNWLPSMNHLLIKGVWDINGIIGYCLKEFNLNTKRLNIDDMYLNNMLFD